MDLIEKKTLDLVSYTNLNKSKRRSFFDLITARKTKIVLDLLSGAPIGIARKLRKEEKTVEEKEVDEFIEKKPHYVVQYRNSNQITPITLKFYKGLINYLIHAPTFNTDILWADNILQVDSIEKTIANKKMNTDHKLLFFNKKLVTPRKQISYFSWIEDLSCFFNLSSAKINKIFKTIFRVTNDVVCNLQITEELQVTYKLPLGIPLMLMPTYQPLEYFFKNYFQKSEVQEKLNLFFYRIFLESNREIIIFEGVSSSKIKFLGNQRDMFKTIIFCYNEDQKDLEIKPTSTVNLQLNTKFLVENTTEIINYLSEYKRLNFVFSTIDFQVQEKIEEYTEEELEFMFGKEKIREKVGKPPINLSIPDLIIMVSLEISYPIDFAKESEEKLVISYISEKSWTPEIIKASHNLKKALENSNKLLQIIEEKIAIKDYLNKKAR